MGPTALRAVIIVGRDPTIASAVASSAATSKARAICHVATTYLTCTVAAACELSVVHSSADRRPFHRGVHRGISSGKSPTVFNPPQVGEEVSIGAYSVHMVPNRFKLSLR